MKYSRLFLSLILLLCGLAYCYSQKYMVINQKGDLKSQFLIETIDSVSFVGYEGEKSDLNGGSEEYSPSYISNFFDGRNISYEDVAIDGRTVYAVGKNCLRVIDWTDEENPLLVKDIDLDPTNKLKCRSVAHQGDYIYVGMRSTLSGSSYPVLPHTRLLFESVRDKYEEADSISDNYLFNQIFKQLHIESFDATTATRIFVYKCKYESGVYRNIIRFNHANGSIAFVSKDFATKEECIASLKPIYKTSKGDSCTVNWEAVPGNYYIFENDVNIKNPTGDTNGRFNNALLNKFFKKLHVLSIPESDITKCFIYKARYENGVYRNIVRLQTNTSQIQFVKNEYQTAAEAVEALKGYYKSSEGDECFVDWSALSDGQGVCITNITSRKLGVFDSYYSNNGAEIIEIKDGCPGVGNYSALLTTSDISFSSACLQKELDNKFDRGSLSLWIKNNHAIRNDVKIPLLFDSGQTALSLILTPNSSSSHSIGIETSDNHVISGAGMPDGEWYNIKLEIVSDNLILSYRSKESGKWNVLLNSKINELQFNALGIGIETENQYANINVDDVFFSTTDIDNEAFVCGKLVVLNKKTLNIENTYNLDMKGTGICIDGNILVLDMLKGCNIYDITQANAPMLKYWHRGDVEKYKEYQECCIFMDNNERKYSLSCNYTYGITILDITDIDGIKDVVVDEFSDLSYNGNVFSRRSYNFDAVVNYPYIYLTHTTGKNYVGTEIDYRGLTVVDISDFNNIRKKVVPAPLEEWTTIYNGDPKPNRIERVGDKLILNNNDKGVIVYSIADPARPVFLENVSFPVSSSVNTICPIGNGSVIFGDDGTSNKSYNLYLYKGF